MRFVQRAGNLPGVGKRLIERQRTLQGRALDVLHDQERRTCFVAHVVEAADMRVLERGGRARLGFESWCEFFLRDLQRDDAIEPRIASAIDITHSAFADSREDFIGTETHTG